MDQQKLLMESDGMNQIEIYAMRCGTVGTDETIPDKRKSRNPYAYSGVLRGKKHQVWLPVYAYLIVHPKGKILVDTGWHTQVRQDQRKHLSWKLNIASKALLPAGEAVTEQLKALGLSSEELDDIVNIPLHFFFTKLLRRLPQ